MKTLIIGALTALLVIASMGSADAARNKRFHDGYDNPTQLAADVQANLDTDLACHTNDLACGGQMLSPELCTAPHWSCAAPIDYLTAILANHPNASVDGHLLRDGGVRLLPAYLRTLIIRKPPPGRYWMACMIRTPKKGKPTVSGYLGLNNCLPREFKPGEMAWVDPHDLTPVLAQDCTNPVGKPERLGGCVYERYYTDESLNDLSVHVKQYGPSDAALDSECPPMILLPGETQWESLFVEDCYDPTCNFTGADGVVGNTGWRTGSHPAVTGMTLIRLPARFAEKPHQIASASDTDNWYRIFYCLKRSNGGGACAVGVQWFNFVYDKTLKAKVATVFYTRADADTFQAKTKQPFVPYWDFDILHHCPDAAHSLRVTLSPSLGM